MIYSQNSLNTFIQCPYKFFLKYKKSLVWKKDDEDDRAYYDSLKSGLDFHLICERHFSNLPTGVLPDSEFCLWLERVKRIVSIDSDFRYLPEFEIRYTMDKFILFSKMDLIKVGKNKIEIYDWKTENKELTYEKVKNRLQTTIYLFMVGENVKYLCNSEIELSDISMNYYQPNLDIGPIRINYSKEKHEENKLYIKNILNKISKLEEDKIQRNHNHCKICEFNYYCNKQIIKFNDVI